MLPHFHVLVGYIIATAISGIDALFENRQGWDSI